ncbi:MAG: G-D-S-L family lipolytic protein [Bacteroidetes bacterium]|nr:G-D-S-L family lipolytic protein [Bacteroidota bacterium]
MKKVLLLFILIPFLFSFAPQKKTRVIFFGDSITELGVKRDRYVGYILKMDSMLKAEKKDNLFELIGSGISGNKVYDLYLRMEEDVLAKNPDVVFIYVGVNDVWHKTLLGTGTDADKFEKFYQTMINKLVAKKIKVVLVTPAVVGEKWNGSNALDADLDKYSNIIRDLSKKNKLPIVDLRKDIMEKLKVVNPDNKEKEVLTYDKVHMNDKGNQFLADEMMKALKSLK